MNELSSIFFRIFNAVLVFAFLGYIFRKYLFSSIKQSIKQDELDKENRLLKKEMLEKQNVAMEHSIQGQRELGKELLGKIDQWAHQQSMRATEMIAVKRETIDAANQRSYARLSQAENELIKKEVIEPAINQARTELIKKFESSGAGKQFLSTLISGLGKRDE